MRREKEIWTVNFHGTHISFPALLLNWGICKEHFFFYDTPLPAERCFIKIMGFIEEWM